MPQIIKAGRGSNSYLTHHGARTRDDVRQLDFSRILNSNFVHAVEFSFFFLNDTAPPELYPLSLHAALPISPARWPRPSGAAAPPPPPAARIAHRPRSSAPPARDSPRRLWCG